MAEQYDQSSVAPQVDIMKEHRSALGSGIEERTNYIAKLSTEIDTLNSEAELSKGQNLRLNRLNGELEQMRSILRANELQLEELNSNPIAYEAKVRGLNSKKVENLRDRLEDLRRDLAYEDSLNKTETSARLRKARLEKEIEVIEKDIQILIPYS